MPRLLWQTASLADPEDPRDPGTRGRQIAAMEAALARTLGRLDSALQPPPGTTGSSTLAEAGAAAGAATERYFALLRGVDGEQGTRSEAASQAALRAQMQLFDIAHGTAIATLAGQKRAATIRRSGLLGGLLALALLGLLLVLRLQRGLTLLQSAALERADAAPAVEGAQPGDRLQARALLERLRGGEEVPAGPTHANFSTSIEPAAATPAQPPPAAR